MYKSIDKNSQYALFFHLFELKFWILTQKNPKIVIYPPRTIMIRRVSDFKVPLGEFYIPLSDFWVFLSDVRVFLRDFYDPYVNFVSPY